MIKTNSVYRFLLFTLVISGAIGYGSGCRKDYSYEGGPGPDSVVVPGPVDPPNPVTSRIPYFCSGCIGHDRVELGRWSFKVDTSLFCGEVTASPITYDRAAFTFFGPSACSQDSGLIMTVYIPGKPLDRDRINLVSNQVSIRYYDNVNQTDMLLSQTMVELQFTIDSYVHSTKIAIGHFSGTAYNSAANPVLINSGKFSIQLP